MYVRCTLCTLPGRCKGSVNVHKEGHISGNCFDDYDKSNKQFLMHPLHWNGYIFLMEIYMENLEKKEFRLMNEKGLRIIVK